MGQGESPSDDRYVRAFGFGSTTGVELPAETRGLYKPINRWSKVSIAAISMGQEIGITPLQLTGLISTMANDGVYVALAVASKAHMVTADERLANALAAYLPVNWLGAF